MITGLLLGVITLAIWTYLIALRGGFWLANTRDDQDEAPAPGFWPAVTAVVPARDEADVIGESLGSLLRQDYPGPFRVILVDDQSRDDTARAATDAAARAGLQERLTVIPGQMLPKGWTGKLWAIRQGVERAESASEPAPFLLLTDADISYSVDVLRGLVSRAVAHGLVLTSLMVKLKCDSVAERSLIPAFVYFFQMLYPFAWVNRHERATAAAAGGCMLVDRHALQAAGGIDAIRDALIDDCALGRQLKFVGPIWLGLTLRVRSLRAYPTFADIRRMVARSAYYQLGYSPLLLSVIAAGLCLTFLAPPALALFAPGAGHGLGLASWALMAISFQPMLRLYGLSPLWGPALPLIAACYLAFTLDSAYQHARGKGGLWKGRIQASASEMP